MLIEVHFDGTPFFTTLIAEDYAGYEPSANQFDPGWYAFDEQYGLDFFVSTSGIVYADESVRDDELPAFCEAVGTAPKLVAIAGLEDERERVWEAWMDGDLTKDQADYALAQIARRQKELTSG